MPWFIDIAEGNAPFTIGPFTTRKMAAKVKTALSSVLPYVSEPFEREHGGGGVVMGGLYERAPESEDQPSESPTSSNANE